LSGGRAARTFEIEGDAGAVGARAAIVRVQPQLPRRRFHLRHFQSRTHDWLTSCFSALRESGDGEGGQLRMGSSVIRPRVSGEKLGPATSLPLGRWAPASRARRKPSPAGGPTTLLPSMKAKWKLSEPPPRGFRFSETTPTKSSHSPSPHPSPWFCASL